MSSYSSSYYRILAQEQRRLEQERQRRLLEEQRRREEERKQQEEMARLRRIAEDKERAGLTGQLKERGVEIQRQEAARHLQELRQTLEKLTTRPEGLFKECDRIGLRLKAAGTKELSALTERIRTLNEQARMTDPQPSVRTKQAVREEMTQALSEIEARLADVPPDLQQICAPDLNRIRATVELVGQAVSGDLSYYQLALKNARRDLAQVIESAEKRRNDWQVRLEAERAVIRQMIVTAEIVRDAGLAPDHQRRARTLVSVLEGLFVCADLSALQPRVPQLREQVARLRGEFDALQQQNDERRFVLERAQEVLSEMGYRQLPIVTEGITGVAPARRLHFLTPQGEAVRLEFGLPNSFRAEFMHPRTRGKPARAVSRAALVASCGNWCADHGRFLKQLEERGVSLSELPNSRVPPEAGAYAELLVTCELPEVVSEEEFRSQHQPEELRKRQL